MANFNKKLKHLALSGLFLATTAGCSNFAKEVPDNNPLHKEEKVEKDLSFYGGEVGYVASSKYDRPNPIPYDFNPFQNKISNESVNHLDTGHNHEIKVGYSYNITENMAEQFNHTFNYLNDIFKVINSNYHFVTGYSIAKECDIYVSNKSIDMNTVTAKKESDVGAVTYAHHHKTTPTIIDSATIHFNKNQDLSTPQLRYYMLHEMLHVLYGSNDVNWEYYDAFSVYNYDDVYYAVSQICQAYESVEDYEKGIINNIGGPFKSDFNLKDKEGNIVETKNSLPVMSLEEKHSFVSLFPTDISTLIAIYGDSSKAENRKAYLELLNKTIEVNQKLFNVTPEKYGQKEGFETVTLPCYKADFKLPESEKEYE